MFQFESMKLRHIYLKINAITDTLIGIEIEQY